MKLQVQAFAALAVALLSGACARAGTISDGVASAASLRVMSFNIRYGTANDGANSWPLRRELALGVLRDNGPTVMGVQEALKFQLDEIRQALPWFGQVGVGREDGGEGGEYSAILYDQRRLSVQENGTFWLSETPEVPGSTSWGNNITRIATWARFRERAGVREFLVLNTHWDHESQNAREKSAAQIVAWLEANAGGKPVIVTGDFNAGEQNAAFQALVAPGNRKVALKDTFRAEHPDVQVVGTFNAFSGKRGGDKIDAVLVSPEWRVLSAAIVTTNDDGRYPSDHFPVTATLGF
jgi:endonuclease/exonuclease/phosphatase family metal-dependent hydrolase